MTCPHPTVRCINQYELIRKYRCESCGAVMMCACDEDVGPLVPKQLAFAVESDTGREVPITAGFQSKVCDACRGLPLKPHPKGPSYGSKIKRYYWREIEFETVKRFRTWWQANGSPKLTLDEKLDVNKKIRREVLDQFKLVHKTAPKYTFATEQQRDVTAEYGIEVVTLRATYGSNSAKRPAIIVDVCGACRVEEYACRHFRSLGYSALVVGNEPIWVLLSMDDIKNGQRINCHGLNGTVIGKRSIRNRRFVLVKMDNGFTLKLNAQTLSVGLPEMLRTSVQSEYEAATSTTR
jgi:hypothetical protein